MTTLLPSRFQSLVASRAPWLAALLLATTAVGGAQAQISHRKHVSSVVRHDSPEDFVRNHGTGVRVGVDWAGARSAVRNGRLPMIGELGAFHQHRLGEVGSVQGELLYFRERATSGAIGQGLRVPVLLVLNPFDNLSFSAGPRLQWQPGAHNAPIARTETDTPTATASPFSMGLVLGTEVRVWRIRTGLRYGAPLAQLSDLPALGHGLGEAWRTGSLQFYVGTSF